MKKFTSALMVFVFTFILSSALLVQPVDAGAQIDSAVRWAVAIANNSAHGYDQIKRWGPDYDCSSLVISAYQQAGIPVKSNGATYTGNMYSVFTKTGFSNVRSSVNLSTGNGLRKGDVLLGSGHTAMVTYASGTSVTIVHARINEKGTAKYGKPGDQTGAEIRTQKYYNHPWTYVLRHKTSGTVTSPTPVPQPTGSYFTRYTGTSGSIVTALNAIGANSSYAYRAKIAAANGITGYSGTAAQNTKMLTLLKAGRLVKPGATVTYFARYTGTSVSIVNALTALRIDSSFAYRARIAARNGIANYSGTPTQNTQMLNLLKAGRLIKP